MNKKEQDILDWEFEELLRQIVLCYLKMTGFNMLQFSTYLDTHRETKEIYDITITKRGWVGEDTNEK